MPEWSIEITPTALEMLKGIRDKRIQSSIVRRIDELTKNPELMGKPLTGPLEGYRSLRAVGQRYRVLYRVEREKVIVYIVAVGIRKEGDAADIYELAQRLVRLGLLGP